MRTPSTTPEHTELASGFTVADYRRAVEARDRTEIADFIHRRFTERYIDPVRNRNSTNGFTIMAVSCLMIETLESFEKGWLNTRGKGDSPFSLFFGSHPQFAEFKPLSGEFYSSVRYGILHQAETRQGWRIVRQGPLLKGRTINAEMFLDSLRSALDAYRDQLKELGPGPLRQTTSLSSLRGTCAARRRQTGLIGGRREVLER